MQFLFYFFPVESKTRVIEIVINNFFMSLEIEVVQKHLKDFRTQRTIKHKLAVSSYKVGQLMHLNENVNIQKYTLNAFAN